MSVVSPVLSQEIWKHVLEYTSVCTVSVMDTILLEETCEMGERIAFDEETGIMRYRSVSRVFADSVLELLTSVTVPQDTPESRSGRLQKVFLSRPVALQKISLFYPSDRLLQPCPMDKHVWEHLALCTNLRHLTLDQNSHVNESNLAVLSKQNGHKLLSLAFCCDIAGGLLNMLHELFPRLESLELQAKSSDQVKQTELLDVPDMSRYKRLKCLIDKDAELLRSEGTMASLCRMPSLTELHIGQNESFLRKNSLEVTNGFSHCLSMLSEAAKDSPILQLRELHICGSYMMRGTSDSIDDSLYALSRTFTNLKVLTIKYASRLLGSTPIMQSLSYLTSLETLDLRKSELAVMKLTSTQSHSEARTSLWCDEYLHYFPISLKRLLLETEASARNMLGPADKAECMASMNTLRNRFSKLQNMEYFSCEAFPTFTRCECKSWYKVCFDRRSEQLLQ